MKNHQKNNDSIEKKLNSLAENTNVNATNEFIKIFISSLIATSPIVDKFSTWLLAGCAATAALMITNIKAIIPFIGSCGFEISIYILMLSALAGLMQKYKAIFVQIMSVLVERLIRNAAVLQASHEKTISDLKITAEKHGLNLGIDLDLDLQRIKKEFSDAVPFFMRRKALEGFDMGTKDELYGWRKMSTAFNWQVKYFLIQFLFFIGFLFVAAVSVK